LLPWLLRRRKTIHTPTDPAYFQKNIEAYIHTVSDTPGSDIDLTLKGEKLRLKLLNKISIDIDDLLLPYSFDISIFHQITNPDLLEHIARAGVVFYKKESDERMLYPRD